MSRYYYNTEETVTTKKKGYIEIEDNYTQVYDNVLDLTKKLSSLLDMQIFLYLAKNSNKHNVFNTSKTLQTDIKKDLEKEFNEATFYKCIERLVNAKLLIKLTKGQYQLNPLTVWRESQVDRRKIIDAIIDGKQLDSFEIVEEEKVVIPSVIKYV